MAAAALSRGRLLLPTPTRTLSPSPSPSGRRRATARRAARRVIEEEGRAIAWPQPVRAEAEEAAGVRAVRALLEEPRWAAGVDDPTVRWFLRDRRYDPPAAAAKLAKMLRWREGLGGGHGVPFPWAEVAPEAGTGKAYVHDRTDRYGRPVIVVDVSRHVTGEWPRESSQRLTGYFLDECVGRLGGEEAAILGVFDLRRFKARNADVGYARFLVDVFFNFYPRRLGRVLFVDAPLIFQPPWQVIKPLLGKYSRLVRFVRSGPELESYFESREDLPRTFR